MSFDRPEGHSNGAGRTVRQDMAMCVPACGWCPGGGGSSAGGRVVSLVALSVSIEKQDPATQAAALAGYSTAFLLKSHNEECPNSNPGSSAGQALR